MSTVLFDTPGPRARRRHRIYSVLALIVVLAAIGFVVRRLMAEGVVSATVINDVLQNRNVVYLMEGFAATLKAAAVAIVTSVLFGTLFAVGQLSDHRIVRWPCTAVVQVFRAIPLVLLLIAVWYGFGISSFSALVIGLTLYNGSVLAEVFRAGINAVPTGQSEAAYAIGMRKTQVMTGILLPQAVRFMLPAIISQCVIILKDTALGFVIIYIEAVRSAKQIAQYVTDGGIVTYTLVAAVFIVINYSLSKLAEYLERRLSRSRKAPAAEAPQPTGVEA